MGHYLHAKIAEVTDSQFQQLVDELYHCANLARDDERAPTLFYLVQQIGVQDRAALTVQHLPTPCILTSKVGKLPQGVLYDLCFEVASLKRTHIESYDNKTVLSLLRTLVSIPPRLRKPGKNQLRHENEEWLIRQRRANGSL